MRVCFLVPGLERSGGIDVIRGHAERLGAELHVTPPEGEWDVALATWWTTIPALTEVRAARRGVFAQGFDPLHYREDEFVDRMAATAALCAPFDVIAVSEWVCELVRALRPSARCRVVAPGIDKEVFGGAPRPAGDGPLRILVEGQPSVWFKGVGDAIAAARAMRRRSHVTLAALDPAGTEGLDVDRVVSGLDGAGMAALYREADVVVKLSRFEGLGLAPLEGFHAGVPCVVTPYGGHAAYAVDGENALVVGFDDQPGTTRALDRLDSDRALLARLSEGALRTAERWPDPAASTDALRSALDGLGPGETDPALLQAIVRQGGSDRVRLTELRGYLAEYEQAIEDMRAELIELDKSRHEILADFQHASAELDKVGRTLDQVITSRAYRAAIALRKVLPGR